MRKKVLVISGVIVAIIVLVLLIILLCKPKYTIKVSIVEERSPDRILTVYKNKEKIEVLRIEYKDGTLLCNGFNPTVYYGDIENEKELKVVLKDKSVVKAQVIKEEE